MARPHRSPARQTWLALVAIALIAGALAWTANAIVAHNRLQNCIDSGRRDCLPMPAGSGD